MNDQELAIQSNRIAQYERLNAARNVLHAALKKLTEDDPDGPCGKGPFTGNTRESRVVSSITVFFTQTRGGAPATRIDIEGLAVEAFDLGKFLENSTRERITKINEEIDKL